MTLDALTQLPGLDVAAGLASVGRREESYLRLLGMLVDHHAHDIAEIRKCLAAGDLEEARRLAHSLKGACATLGASAARDAALAVEMTIKQGGDPAAALQTLSAVLAPLQAGLRDVLPTLSAPAAPAQAVADSDALLSRLQGYLEQDDLQAGVLWRDHRADFESCLGAAASGVRQAIEQYDFSAALRLLRCAREAGGMT